jgi:hypothetical protein
VYVHVGWGYLLARFARDDVAGKITWVYAVAKDDWVRTNF